MLETLERITETRTRPADSAESPASRGRSGCQAGPRPSPWLHAVRSSRRIQAPSRTAWERSGRCLRDDAGRSRRGGDSGRQVELPSVVAGAARARAGLAALGRSVRAPDRALGRRAPAHRSRAGRFAAGVCAAPHGAVIAHGRCRREGRHAVRVGSRFARAGGGARASAPVARARVDRGVRFRGAGRARSLACRVSRQRAGPSRGASAARDACRPRAALDRGGARQERGRVASGPRARVPAGRRPTAAALFVAVSLGASGGALVPDGSLARRDRGRHRLRVGVCLQPRVHSAARPCARRFPAALPGQRDAAVRAARCSALSGRGRRR